MHTFEGIRTRIPTNPNEAAPEAAMRRAAWEVLLRDAVQGLRPPHSPETLRRWLQTTHPQAWAIGAPQAPAPPHHHHTGKGKGKGKGRERTAWQGGEERPKVAGRRQQDRAPGATQHGGKKPSKGQEGEGPGAVAQRERAQQRAPGCTYRKGTPEQKEQHRPTPSRHRATPGGARPARRATKART